MAEVRVDPALLRARAEVCAALREALRRCATDVEPEVTDAARGLPGWHTSRALEDLLWWWRDDLAKLGEFVGGLGDALRACADDYRGRDESTSAHFHRLRRD